MREIERKYEVAADFRVPAGELPDGVVLGEPAEYTLTATYYDTPDLRLARDHVTLRRRTGGKDDGWRESRGIVVRPGQVETAQVNGQSVTRLSAAPGITISVRERPPCS